jgi:hypothetical protein
MLQVQHLVGFGAAAISSPPSFTFIGMSLSNASLTTYTFTAVDLGADDPDRVFYIPISAAAGSNRNVVSVTVLGESATIVTSNAASVNYAGVAAIRLPSGNSGNIIVELSGSAVTAGIGLYRAVGYSEGATHSVTTNATGSQSLTTPVGGVAVAIAYSGNAAITFTGLTTDDSGAAAANRNYGVGSAQSLSSGSLSIDATGTSFTGLSAASFAPLS